MPGTNLSRDETASRARLIDVDSYDISLDLTGNTSTFRSKTTIRFRCSEPGAETWLDLIAPKVRRVRLNGELLDAREVYDGSRVTLPRLAAENEVEVVADAAYMHTGEGLHRFVDPVDDEVYVYTQFEVPDARRVYACFEQPDLKATFAFTVLAPPHWEVISNSPPPKSVRNGSKGNRWRFKPTPRISTYVTAIVAGPFHGVRDSFHGARGTIPLGVYCRRSLAKHLDAAAILKVTKQGFKFFERKFDYPYPFEKYDQIFVPEFNAGAMENVGCVTHSESYLFRSRVTDAAYERRANTILHELAHMWFGNLVTMRWWDDLWLNESFADWAATFCQAEATKWTGAWTTFANSEKLWALYQDQLPSTHPIYADIPDLQAVEVNFDGITYAKGASVLKQLVAWVGEDAFLRGLRQYFRAHEWGNTQLADLFKELAETSGRDLAEWEREWLRTAGVNTLVPQVEVGPDGTYQSAKIIQRAPDSQPTLRSHRVRIGLYDRTDEGMVRRDRLELDVTGPQTEAAELIGRRRADVLLVNDDDLTFAKIRFDDHSLKTLIESIGELTEPLPRALCWTAATDMLRDAELATRDFVALVLGGLDRETELSVVQTLLARTRSAIDLYADPGHRILLSALWASGLHRLAHAAEPGSDHQLAFARAWAEVAASTDHVNELRGLLDGTSQIPGLVIDTELRWHLLHRLVILGAADDADIDAELKRDPTATGRERAAYARAARPTLAAKEEVWHQVVESDELPNAIQVAMLAGFAQPDHRDLLYPFVDRYFAMLTDLWSKRTFEDAKRIATRLYPRLLVEDDIIWQTREWLANTQPPAALARLVREGQADVERALRAQQCDRAAAESDPAPPLPQAAQPTQPE